ncbi:OLC1v1031021C1 [Oldenlandia corymbosa var. corymbosa]|uniref:OLC1v1031021C1 n=1 Tax=Oldenlandia corymbosa var. corymbosa TaxID=529605 RepID=A0AAV1CHJ6_OLDCO|nr:OLC1v1031021C1 [Oldenlandia corymbosa var. corymbosa]
MDTDNIVVFIDMEWSKYVKENQQSYLVELGIVIVSHSSLVPIGNPMKWFFDAPREYDHLKKFQNCEEFKRSIIGFKSPEEKEDCKDIHKLLDRKVWAGFNLLNADCNLIGNVFCRASVSIPVPDSIIEVLELFRRRFSPVKNSTKRPFLLSLKQIMVHFDLGKQEYPAIPDILATIEVMKCVAGVLFLDDGAENPKGKKKRKMEEEAMPVKKLEQLSLSPSFLSRYISVGELSP